MTEELEENIIHRGKAYMSSKNSMLIQDENDEFLGERSSSCEKT